MRIQLKLSQECESILNLKKAQYDKQEGVSVTYGWLVNFMMRDIFPIRESINWLEVKKKPIAHLSNEKKDYNTTLNLEQTAIDNIILLQLQFKEIFNTVRIHKAFVVRMVVKAHYLIQNNVNIYEKEV